MSRCSSTVDCAFDFFVQQVSASSVAAASKTTTACAAGGGRELIRIDLIVGNRNCRNQLLFSHDQHFELSVFYGGEEELVRLGVERHSLGSRHGLYGLDEGIFVGAVFMNHGYRALAVGVGDELGLRIEGGGVDVIADGQRGDDLTGVGVHHRHDFAAAAQEQAPVCAVHGHAAGRSAGSGRPALLDFQFAGIDFEDKAFILEIIEDEAG